MGKIAAGTVTVEVTTWVTRYVGGDGSGSRLFQEPAAPGETPRAILRRWSARFPELEAALWNPQRTELGEHIEVLVNDAVLGVAHELDSPVAGGGADHPPRPIHGRRLPPSIERPPSTARSWPVMFDAAWESSVRVSR